MVELKPLEFLGDSLARLREFPEDAKKEAGVQLHKVQQGLEPSDWKPMPTVGSGVREIRIREESGALGCFTSPTLGRRCLCCTPSRRRRKRRPKGI